MSVLVENGHHTTYPLNHARIMWDNKITAATATGAKNNYPAAAALTKTTYERWSPAVSGDSITLTFPEQYINCIALAAHSNLNPTVEVRVNGTFEAVTAYPPAGDSLELSFDEDMYGVFEYSPDNEAIMFLIQKRMADAVRITATYTGTAPTLGVVMAGTVLEMHRPLYAGHNPALLSSDSQVQPNVSESGEWLGASLLRQGRNVNISWNNLPASWVRKYWQPFAQGLKTNPFVVAWNPLKASPDAIYCSSSNQPQPNNSGTRNLQSVRLTARGYSDGTDPVVRTIVDKNFADLITFTRASEATYYDAQGVLRTAAIDEPRLTHDPVTGESLGLLIEEQRTNLLLWSEAFDNAVWSKVGVTVTSNSEEAPDGNTKADKIIPTTANGSKYVEQSASVTDSESYSYGAFVKFGGYKYFQIILSAGLTTGYQNFDLVDGVLASNDSIYDASIKHLGGGWYFCSVENATVSGTSLNASFSVLQTDGVRAASYTGDGTSGIYIWGAQLEAGSFPTSYIKTEASQVTRSADNASVDDLSGLLAQSFTLFSEQKVIASSDADGNNLALLGNLSTDKVSVFYAGSARGVGEFLFITNNGSGLGSTTIPDTGLRSGDTFKMALVREGNACGLYINGDFVASRTIGTPTSKFTRLILDNQESGTVYPSLRAIDTLIPRALSAEELQILTAPEAS